MVGWHSEVGSALASAPKKRRHKRIPDARFKPLDECTCMLRNAKARETPGEQNARQPRRRSPTTNLVAGQNILVPSVPLGAPGRSTERGQWVSEALFISANVLTAISIIDS